MKARIKAIHQILPGVRQRNCLRWVQLLDIRGGLHSHRTTAYNDYALAAKHGRCVSLEISYAIELVRAGQARGRGEFCAGRYHQESIGYTVRLSAVKIDLSVQADVGTCQARCTSLDEGARSWWAVAEGV